MADNVAVTPGSGATIAADDVGGVLYQRVKISYGGDGSATDLIGPATGTQTSVASSATSGTILASNASRKGATITNDDTNGLYLLLASGTASATNYTVLIPTLGYYELPVCIGGVYTGIIVGIWDADGAGSARVTELT
jgi:hypothetical protein